MTSKVKYCYKDDELVLRRERNGKAVTSGLQGSKVRSQSLKDLNTRGSEGSFAPSQTLDGDSDGDSARQTGFSNHSNGRVSHLHPNNVSKKTYLGGRIARRIQDWENAERVDGSAVAVLTRSKSERSLYREDDTFNSKARRSQSHKAISGRRESDSESMPIVWRISSSSSWEETEKSKRSTVIQSTEQSAVDGSTDGEATARVVYVHTTTADEEVSCFLETIPTIVDPIYSCNSLDRIIYREYIVREPPIVLISSPLEGRSLLPPAVYYSCPLKSEAMP